MATKEYHTLIQALLYEPQRYKHKGLIGILFNILYWYCYCTYARDFLRTHWEWYMGLADWRILFTVTLYAINISVLVIYNLVMWPIYAGWITCFQKYKIVEDKPWHWKQDFGQWMRIMKNSFKVVMFNALIVVPIFIYIMADNSKVRRDVESFQDGWTIFFQIWFLQMVESTVHGFFHNILHHKLFYDRFHKMHHQYTNVIALAAQYFSIVEYMFASLLPVMVGNLILGPKLHYSTYILFTIWRIGRGHDSHVGYEFPWSIYSFFPLCATSQYHNYHHSHNVGNYQSSYVLFDSLLGRNREYWRYLKQKKARKDAEEAKRKQIKSK